VAAKFDTGLGLYAGSAVLEGAQVLTAGHAVSEPMAETTVIEKMLRVMMLALFLLILGKMERRPAGSAARRITVPWFAILFVVASAINSAG
jgi:uncharacterized membrane protein YadS